MYDYPNNYDSTTLIRLCMELMCIMLYFTSDNNHCLSSVILQSIHYDIMLCNMFPIMFQAIGMSDMFRRLYMVGYIGTVANGSLSLIWMIILPFVATCHGTDLLMMFIPVLYNIIRMIIYVWYYQGFPCMRNDATYLAVQAQLQGVDYV